MILNVVISKWSKIYHYSAEDDKKGEDQCLLKFFAGDRDDEDVVTSRWITILLHRPSKVPTKAASRHACGSTFSPTLLNIHGNKVFLSLLLYIITNVYILMVSMLYLLGNRAFHVNFTNHTIY